MNTADIHPLAPEHVPGYVVSPDGSDMLFTVMVVFTLALILGIGILYLTLHAMPERMAHSSNHSQMQVIGILALLALFTHNNAFWVVAILVAAFRPPDFLTPIKSIARSLSKIAAGGGTLAGTVPAAPEPPEPPAAHAAHAAPVAPVADTKGGEG